MLSWAESAPLVFVGSFGEVRLIRTLGVIPSEGTDCPSVSSARHKYQKGVEKYTYRFCPCPGRLFG